MKTAFSVVLVMLGGFCLGGFEDAVIAGNVPYAAMFTVGWFTCFVTGGFGLYRFFERVLG